MSQTVWVVELSAYDERWSHLAATSDDAYRVAAREVGRLLRGYEKELADGQIPVYLDINRRWSPAASVAPYSESDRVAAARARLAPVRDLLASGRLNEAVQAWNDLDTFVVEIHERAVERDVVLPSNPELVDVV